MQRNLLGVVLCGGQSVRMGEDKGLMNYQGEKLFKIQLDKLKSICENVVISIKQDQIEKYKANSNSENYIIDSISIPGPLKGILSVHQSFPDKDLLVLACDIPLLSKEILINLIEKSSLHSHDFYVYCNEGEYEPLAGVYTAKGLDLIKKTFEEGNLQRYSMKNALEIGQTFTIEMSEAEKPQFKNFNFKGDLYTDLSDTPPENKIN